MPVHWTRPRPSLLSHCWHRCRPYTSLCASHGTAIAVRPAVAPARPIFARCRGLTTLFYSTVIAAASTLDVRAKHSRRDQWDEAITKLESELSDDRGEGRGERQGAAAAATPATPRTDDDAERQRARLLFDSRPDSPLAGRIVAEAVGNIREPEKMDWKFEHAAFSPQSIYALESERSHSSLNPTALIRMEYTVAKLAASMLRTVDKTESTGQPGPPLGLHHGNRQHAVRPIAASAPRPRGRASHAITTLHVHPQQRERRSNAEPIQQPPQAPQKAQSRARDPRNDRPQHLLQPAHLPRATGPTHPHHPNRALRQAATLRPGPVRRGRHFRFQNPPGRK